ncbi:uncharacterized protein BN652_01639 [Firmicutes bacterium CAG:424]|jgi:hypothetical protein|nr:uncharacterized protein BN652_01639 [Firmicutes bacterium CAG:424]
MLTNTDITIYNRIYDPKTRLDTWKQFYVPEAWWFKKEQSSITTDGRKNADVYTIRIPDTSVTLKKDDYVVKGMCAAKMETVKDLEGLEKARITSVNYNTFGGNPHIKAVGV